MSKCLLTIKIYWTNLVPLDSLGKNTKRQEVSLKPLFIEIFNLVPGGVIDRLNLLLPPHDFPPSCTIGYPIAIFGPRAPQVSRSPVSCEINVPQDFFSCECFRLFRRPGSVSDGFDIVCIYFRNRFDIRSKCSLHQVSLLARVKTGGGAGGQGYSNLRDTLVT